MTYIPYGPMGGGVGYEQMGRNRLLRELGERYGVSLYQIILAGLLGKSPRVIPIPGAARETSIRDSAAAARLSLEPRDAAGIDALA